MVEPGRKTTEERLWTVEGMTDGENEDATVMRWYAQDEVNQEDSEQNKVDGMELIPQVRWCICERAVGDL